MARVGRGRATRSADSISGRPGGLWPSGQSCSALSPGRCSGGSWPARARPLATRNAFVHDVRRYAVNPTTFRERPLHPEEDGDALNVEGLGEEVDGLDGRDAVAPRDEAAQVTRQRGRVARDVDDARHR